MFIIGIISSWSSAQNIDYNYEEPTKTALTVGLLNGGGLLGAEIETLLKGKVGAHIGFGFVGACVGLNYHLKPTTRSSFFTMELRVQGFSTIYTDTSLGLGYVLRYKGLSAQLGAAYILDKGPNTISNWNDGRFVPQISLGGYNTF